MVLSMSAPCMVAFGKYSFHPLSDALGIPPCPMLFGIRGFWLPIPSSNTFFILFLFSPNSLWYSGV